MIDLFKNALWYIIKGACTVLLHMLKYVPGVQGVHETVSIRPRYLTFVLDQAVSRTPWGLKHVSDDLKDKWICEWVIHKNPRMLKYVPDHFETREMCDDAVGDDASSLVCDVDWFVTQQQLKIWYDDYYCNDDEVIKWYDSHKKRKTQKSKIKEELMPIAWHR